MASKKFSTDSPYHIYSVEFEDSIIRTRFSIANKLAHYFYPSIFPEYYVKLVMLSWTMCSSFHVILFDHQLKINFCWCLTNKLLFFVVSMIYKPWGTKDNVILVLVVTEKVDMTVGHIMRLALFLLAVIPTIEANWGQWREANWKGKFNKKSWVRCDHSTECMTGLYRTDGNIGEISLIERAMCYQVPSPNLHQQSLCKKADWWKTWTGQWRAVYLADAPNDGFLQNTLKTLFSLSRVLLDL